MLQILTPIYGLPHHPLAEHICCISSLFFLSLPIDVYALGSLKLSMTGVSEIKTLHLNLNEPPEPFQLQWLVPKFLFEEMMDDRRLNNLLGNDV